MQAIIDTLTRTILGVGFFDTIPPAGQAVVEIPESQIVKLGGPGVKTIAANGTITVTIPQEIVAVEQQEAQERTDRLATIALIKPIVQGAVGKNITALSAAEVRALVAVLLWREDALDAAGNVRPLGRWVRE